MKKLFSAFTVVLLAFCFISCAPQEFSGSSLKNNGSVSLSIDKSTRTISPAEGISYTNVQTWTVKFQDTTASHLQKYDDIIVKYVNFNEYPSKEIRLPIGTYKIIFEGSATKSESSDNPVEVPFYGEDSVTVEKNQTVYKSVCVAPKKSDKGTGSFDFTVNISGLEKSDDLSPLFECHLIPYGETSQEPLIKSILNEELTTLTITAQNIPSGLYKLSIVCSWIESDSYNGQVPESKEIFYPYHDFLVEIIDGLTTTGSTDITVSLEESKTYYATKGTSKGNGAFASMPKNFDALLEEIDSSVSFVNIYMVDENPSIDVSRIKKGITYNIYNKNGTQLYSIYAETEQIPFVTMFINNITLSGGQANLIYLGSEETSEINCTLQNASVLVDSPITINIQNLEYSNYYENNPCVIMQNPDNSNVILSESLTASYKLTTDQTETEIKYYITPVKTTSSQTDGFVLYDNTSDATQPLLFYAAFSDEGLKSQPLIEKNSSLKIIDYCFDLTNNLYALVEKSGSYSVYKYNNAANSFEEYSLSAQDIKIQCIECSGSSLYAVVETNENEYFAKLTLDDSSKTVQVETYKLTQWILNPSTHNDIKTFCVNGTNLYAVAAFSDSTITRTAIFTATIDETKKTITMGQYIPLAEVNQTSQSSSYQFDNYGTNLEYRDLCYINKNLYLLIRDVQQPENSAEAITSRGAVCIYELSNGIVRGDIIGYQEQEEKISYTFDVGNNSTTERQTYIGDGISTFCGPVKFVSFNESALFIADNGFSLKTEAYSQIENHTQCTATSKNSIVTFDLSLNDLSFKSLNGECFDKNYSGYFYGTSFTGNE